MYRGGNGSSTLPGLLPASSEEILSDCAVSSEKQEWWVVNPDCLLCNSGSFCRVGFSIGSERFWKASSFTPCLLEQHEATGAWVRSRMSELCSEVTSACPVGWGECSQRQKILWCLWVDTAQVGCELWFRGSCSQGQVQEIWAEG